MKDTRSRYVSIKDRYTKERDLEVQDQQEFEDRQREAELSTLERTQKEESRALKRRELDAEKKRIEDEKLESKEKKEAYEANRKSQDSYLKESYKELLDYVAGGVKAGTALRKKVAKDMFDPKGRQEGETLSDVESRVMAPYIEQAKSKQRSSLVRAELNSVLKEESSVIKKAAKEAELDSSEIKKQIRKEVLEEGKDVEEAMAPFRASADNIDAQKKKDKAIDEARADKVAKKVAKAVRKKTEGGTNLKESILDKAIDDVTRNIKKDSKKKGEKNYITQSLKNKVKSKVVGIREAEYKKKVEALDKSDMDTVLTPTGKRPIRRGGSQKVDLTYGEAMSPESRNIYKSSAQETEAKYRKAVTKVKKFIEEGKIVDGDNKSLYKQLWKLRNTKGFNLPAAMFERDSAKGNKDIYGEIRDHIKVVKSAEQEIETQVTEDTPAGASKSVRSKDPSKRTVGNTEKSKIGVPNKKNKETVNTITDVLGAEEAKKFMEDILDKYQIESESLHFYNDSTTSIEGYYDVETDSVYINVAYVKLPSDAQRIIAHEFVGHRGFRMLFRSAKMSIKEWTKLKSFVEEKHMDFLNDLAKLYNLGDNYNALPGSLKDVLVEEYFAYASDKSGVKVINGVEHKLYTNPAESSFLNRLLQGFIDPEWDDGDTLGLLRRSLDHISHKRMATSLDVPTDKDFEKDEDKINDVDLATMGELISPKFKSITDRFNARKRFMKPALREHLEELDKVRTGADSNTPPVGALFSILSDNELPELDSLRSQYKRVATAPNGKKQLAKYYEPLSDSLVRTIVPSKNSNSELDYHADTINRYLRDLKSDLIASTNSFKFDEKGGRAYASHLLNKHIATEIDGPTKITTHEALHAIMVAPTEKELYKFRESDKDTRL